MYENRGDHLLLRLPGRKEIDQHLLVGGLPPTSLLKYKLHMLLPQVVFTSCGPGDVDDTEDQPLRRMTGPYDLPCRGPHGTPKKPLGCRGEWECTAPVNSQFGGYISQKTFPERINGHGACSYLEFMFIRVYIESDDVGKC